MDTSELIECLRYCSRDETDCPACKRWNHDCGSMKCVDDLLLTAADALESRECALQKLRQVHDGAKGSDKVLLGEVLKVFGEELWDEEIC